MKKVLFLVILIYIFEIYSTRNLYGIVYQNRKKGNRPMARGSYNDCDGPNEGEKFHFTSGVGKCPESCDVMRCVQINDICCKYTHI